MRLLWAATTAALLFGCSGKSAPAPPQAPPSPVIEAAWPWKGAKKEQLAAGVTRWHAVGTDGCLLELVEFDFSKNPRLRFRMYDQDQDDARPWDNETDYYSLGVGRAVRHLNRLGHGRVLAAWNGLFFGYDRSKNPPHGLAKHIGPVVVDGQLHHNVGNYRWTFGASIEGGKPRSKVIHLPSKAQMQKELEFGAVGAQCLVFEKKALFIAAYPKPGTPLAKQPVPSTPADAGHIPVVDHMKTSRTSLGWSKDSSKLWLLYVSEADHEVESKLVVKHGGTDKSGWQVSDLQRFWLAFGADYAINLDGGVVSQLALLMSSSGYLVHPARIAAPQNPVLLDADDKAPEGGALMYFYITQVAN